LQVNRGDEKKDREEDVEASSPPYFFQVKTCLNTCARLFI